MTTVRSVKQNDDLETILAILEEDGCVVIEDVLSETQLHGVTRELDPHFGAASHCSGDFYGYVTKRLSGLIGKSAAARQMAVHPTILAVMDAFLLKSCSEYQLNLTQAISIGPGEPQQIVHRDELMFHYEHPGQEAMINCMWAVDDFTNENGATHVVPGSHKWAKDRQPEPQEITQGAMRAGSVLIYLGSLIHGGGANKTARPRTGLVISYCNGWLRQAENQYLAVPRELAAQFPEKLQRLMGYFVHKPNLGCVEGQDPILLLKGQNLQGGEFTEFLPDEVKPMLKEYRDNLLKTGT
jgi:ectoine hydroxylase-related dioxygenase (phytanoyl-CoA dioxygenase family)